jgi:hypothetical protein
MTTGNRKTIDEGQIRALRSEVTGQIRVGLRYSVGLPVVFSGRAVKRIVPTQLVTFVIPTLSERTDLVVVGSYRRKI